MIDLDFAVAGIEIARNSIAPLLLFKLQVTNPTPAEIAIENVSLQAQIRIQATHRSYAPAERDKLSELFGERADWDHTLRDLLWANAGTAVPGFAATCTVDLPVPCSYDFTVAATRYFYGVETGEVPLLLLFSGTIFYRDAEGNLQIAQVAHHKEAGFHLPAALWHRLMNEHYRDRVWLTLGRDLFDELYRYKRRHRLASWDEAVRRLLEAEAEAGAGAGA